MARTRGRGVGGDHSKRTRYQESKANHRLVTLIVPAVSPEEDPMSTSTRTIDLYVVDRSGDYRSKELWLDLDDLEWAVRFMYMGSVLKPVPVPGDDTKLLCTPVTPQKRKLSE